MSERAIDREREGGREGEGESESERVGGGGEGVRGRRGGRRPTPSYLGRRREIFRRGLEEFANSVAGQPVGPATPRASKNPAAVGPAGTGKATGIGKAPAGPAGPSGTGAGSGAGLSAAQMTAEIPLFALPVRPEQEEAARLSLSDQTIAAAAAAPGASLAVRATMQALLARRTATTSANDAMPFAASHASTGPAGRPAAQRPPATGGKAAASAPFDHASSAGVSGHTPAQSGGGPAEPARRLVKGMEGLSDGLLARFRKRQELAHAQVSVCSCLTCVPVCAVPLLPGRLSLSCMPTCALLCRVHDHMHICT